MMICREAGSQPQRNWVHIDMLPYVWLMIKRYLLEAMKEKKLEIYYDKDVIMPTLTRGVFVTPDKRIQLTTVECHPGEHHKSNRMIAVMREYITILQCVWGGARVRHPKPKSEGDRETRKWAKTISKSQLSLIPGDAAALGATSILLTPSPPHRHAIYSSMCLQQRQQIPTFLRQLSRVTSESTL
jgi:hypothetical protein